MKNQAQRQQILDAAFAKFRQFGIRRVTLDEIARDLRISKKTLYQHFASKEELVHACTVQVRQSVLPAVREAMTGDGSIGERVLGVWKALSNLPRSISREFISDLKADYPHIWAEVDQQRKAAVAGIEELYRAGIESGEVWPQIHPRVAVRVLLAILDGVFVPEVMLQADFTPAEALTTIMTLMTRGSLTEPPPLDREDTP